MVPELGHFSLIIAFCLALTLSVIPLVGSYRGNVLWMSASRSMAIGMFVFVSVSFVCLSWAFLNDDFSVKYVAGHSNTLLPAYYKLSAVWGGHEGSLLLWMMILASWIFAVSVFSRKLPIEMLSRVLSVMGMISVGFLSFLILTSNPFERLLPNVPVEGSDLNPLLQDIGLIFHPPMLYMGYVGFSVAFAFAITALLSGRLDSAWARWSRPWTNVAWAFLTLGIALGSWWAYYELGWGGWWFWDPVENASFMPWLVGTALIHSLSVTEKRGVFKSWTILLAIFAFSLSLLGTFLVRSGVLTSVHAFANDPERGVFILGFLIIVIGGSLLLYALRAPAVKNTVVFSLLSRETFLLSNNIVLVVITATILLGTLYPLIADALDLGKISVGPPYFNFFFVPLMGVLSLLIGIGILTNWKKTVADRIKPRLYIPVAVSLVIGLVFPWLYSDQYQWLAALSVFVGTWVVAFTFADLVHKVRNSATLSAGLKKLSPSYYGMCSAHLGVAVSLLGITLNTLYSEQKDMRLEVNSPVSIGGYEYTLAKVANIRGPNYVSEQGIVEIKRNGNDVAVLKPEKRRYLSGGNIMTEAGIDAGFTRDLYVALGEPLGSNAWAVRLHFKPFVRWIWLGAIFMALGGMITIIDKRYRIKKRQQDMAAQRAGQQGENLSGSPAMGSAMSNTSASEL